jgi:hypothetical protein
MEKAIKEFGLHLAVMLTARGADDQAVAEIAESLKRSRERNKLPPPDLITLHPEKGSTG